MSRELDKQINFINIEHALLVFPIKNRSEPLSLWKVLYPKTEMRWEWDEEGDGRVFKLWQSREQLAKSGKVVYTKWYQNRATLFSKELFVNMLAFFESVKLANSILERSSPGTPREARLILEALNSDSPISTKQVKEAGELQGKLLESRFNKVMKELWSNMLIVAYGEIQDSSFPSLAIGSTQVLFEDLWNESATIPKQKAFQNIIKLLGPKHAFVIQMMKQGMPKVKSIR